MANHLSLHAPECYERLGTLAQQNPPIREKNHQDALWKALNDDVVDIIASDHAPHTLDEKAKTYPKSPSGTPGVQTLVPIMLNHVNNGKLSLSKLVSFGAMVLSVFIRYIIKEELKKVMMLISLLLI